MPTIHNSDFQIELTEKLVYVAHTGRTTPGYRVIHLPSKTPLPGIWSATVARQIRNACNDADSLRRPHHRME